MKKSKKDGESILTDCLMVVLLDLDDLIIQCPDMNHNYMRRISESEVKETLKRMNQEKLLSQMKFLLRYGDA